MIKLKALLLTVLALSHYSILVGQNQMNYWFFGENAGLNFNTTPPTVITNSSLQTFEASSSISDADGNLLFYTNGGPYVSFNYTGGVWNRNGVLMPNGDLSSVNTCNSSMQGTVIVPDPANQQGYYIFATDCIENARAGGLRYHYVDMSLEGGNGDVVSKNTLVVSNVTETLIAIKDQSNCGYWIVTHGVANNQYVVIHLTSAGISTPVYYNVGSTIPELCGQLSCSPDGTKIAFPANYTTSYLVDFNPNTGVISNEINLSQNGIGSAFSSNGRYLYIIQRDSPYQVHQFDLQAGSIPASRISIGTIPVNLSAGYMTRGPDGKIYIAEGDESLSYINNPNTAGTACGFVGAGINLGTHKSKWGLPNFCNQYDCILTPVQHMATTAASDLYPNVVSSNGQLTVNAAAEGYSLSIYDISGKSVMTIKDGNAEQLDLLPYTLKSGLYSFQLYYNNGKSSSGKIMIQ